MYYSKSNLVISFIFISFTSSFLPSCRARAAYDIGNNYSNQNGEQIKFPIDEELPAPVSVVDTKSQPDIGASGSSAGEEDNEILKDLPANIDLNNLTPEQKEAFEELVKLAEEEDSAVQGRTLGLFKHKFTYLWNKFASLFTPHKFFEFEHIPSVPFGGYGGDGPYKRVQEPYPQGPVIRIPSLFGGITRFFSSVLPNQYDSGYHQPGPGPYKGDIQTHEEHYE